MGTTRTLLPLSAARARQGLLLLGLLLWVWCLGYAASAWSQTPRTAARAKDDSPAWQQLQAQTLSPTQPDRFAWPRAAEALGRPNEARDLQLALLDDWLLGLEGQPPQQARSIQTAIAHGKGLRADDLQARAQRVWPSVLQSRLQPLWTKGGPSVPLPSEIDALRNDLSPEGPGLWIHRAKDGQPRGLYLWLGVRNSGAAPLPLPQFTLLLGGGALALQCSVPRYGPLAVVAPHHTLDYLCRNAEATLASPPQGLSWLALMDRWLTQGATLRTELPAQDQALSRTSQLLGQLPSAAVDEFIRSTQSCEARGTCRSRAQAPAEKKTQAADKPSPLVKQLQFAAGLVGVLGLYALVAHYAGTRLASGLIWVGLAILCGLFVQSLWSTTGWGDSSNRLWLILATPTALAVPFLGTFLAHGAYQLLVSTQARRKAFYGAVVVGGLVIEMLLIHLLKVWWWS